MEWRQDASPEVEDIITISQPMIMRQTLKCNSFGHLLRDNLRAIAELAAYFSVAPWDLQWIPEPLLSVPVERMEHGIMSHYMPLISPHPLVTWRAVLDSAKQAHGTAPTHEMEIERAFNWLYLWHTCCFWHLFAEHL
jgi:hypothetical protein